MAAIPNDLRDLPSELPDGPITVNKTGSSFRRGLRQGFTAAEGQLRAVAGRTAETLGADEFARDQYAQSAALDELAQQQGPEISDYKQINSLRSAGSFLAGQAGAMLPTVGTGVLGAIAAPAALPAAALVGATAATAPLLIGSSIQRQEANPLSQEKSLTERNLIAGVEGTANAALENVIPQFLGGKLIGRGANSAIARAAAANESKKMIVAKNLSEGVLGEGATGVASEALGQQVDTYFDPNRDTSGDGERLFDAGAAGAIVGGPFGALGVAGDLRARRAAGKQLKTIQGEPQAALPAPAAAAPVPEPKALTFDEQVSSLGSLLQNESMTGREYADASIDPTPGVESAQSLRAKDEAGEAMARSKAQAKVDDIMSDADDETKAAVSKFDAGSIEGQRAIGEMSVKVKMARRTAKAMDDAQKDLDALDAASPPPEGTSFSKDTSGVSKKILSYMQELSDSMSAKEAEKAADFVRRVMTIAETTGDVPVSAARGLSAALDKDTVKRLSKIYDALGSKDPVKVDSFYKALGKVADVQKNDDSLLSTVREALPSNLIDSITMPQLREFVDGMKSLAGENLSKTMTANEMKIKKTQIDDQIQSIFGENAEKVNEAFAKHAQNEVKLIGTTPPDRTVGAGRRDSEEEGGLDESTDDGGADSSFDQEDSEADISYVGGGKKSMDFIENRNVARGKYPNVESQAERIERETQNKFPDARVEYVSAKDFAKEQGIPDDVLMERTGGKPENFGMMRATRMNDKEFGWKDVDAMRVGTNKKFVYKSESRIDTPSGQILDAMAVARHMGGKIDDSTVDDQGYKYKLARQFTEGLAAVSVQLDEQIDVPDSTVVGVRNGVSYTWGELRNLQNDTVKESFESGEYTTSELRGKISKSMLDIEKSEKEVTRLKNKATLTDSQERSLEYNQSRIAKLTEVVANMEDAIVRRGDNATFAEAKELGNDFGTGRDSGAGINMSAERARAEKQTEYEYGTFIERVKTGAGKGKIAEAAVWAQETARVAAKLKQTELNMKSASANQKGVARQDYGRLLNYKKALESRDLNAIEIMQRSALNDATAADTNAKAIDAKSRDDKPLGVSEIDPEGQISMADKAYGNELGTITGKMKSTRSEQTGATSAGRGIVPKGKLGEGTVTQIGKNSVGNRLNQFEAAAKTKEERATISKARDLLAGIDTMDVKDQRQLARLANFERLGAVAGTVESLYKQYETPMRQMTWANSVANEGGAQHAASLKQLARRNNPRDLQGILKAMNADAKPNKYKQALIDAANTRLEELVAANSDEAYALMTRGNDELNAARETFDSRVKTDASRETTPEQQKAIVDYINKVTDSSVDVDAAARALGFAGAYRKGGADHRPAIAVSVHAMDPMSVAYHESLHWFADHLRKNADPAVFGSLMKVADSAYVRNFLRQKFKDQPDVLKQIEESAEERVAYMYQFHANGMLKLGDAGKSWMTRWANYIKAAMGVWSNDKRATHIMDFFQSGKYAANMGDRNAVHKMMMKEGRNKTLDYLHDAAEPMERLIDTVAGIGSQRINDMQIPALSKLMDTVRKHGTKEGEDGGYLPAARLAMTEYSNKMVKRMGAFTFEEANEAFAAISLGAAPKNANQMRVMDGLRSTLADMRQYMIEAGVDVGNRGQGLDYIPRQWDAAHIAGNQDAFKTMMKKYTDSGQYTGSVDELISRLMRDEGSEIETADATARPGSKNTKKRDLFFITAADAQPFLEQSAMRTMIGYIRGGTRRAEWSRRFEKGADKDGVTPLDKMRAAAVEQGATPEQMAVVEKYLMGVTGQLGSELSAEKRRLFGNIMVYQNLRLLPLGFFSSLIDPVGVMVRGGSAKDAFNNFRRGMQEIPRGFKKTPAYDERYQFAEDLGVIDNAVLQHVMGASYGLNAVGNRARAINETLFKYNLMEQMNTSQRVAGTEAAMGFLKKHAKGDHSVHSMRYLAEIGLKPADIIMTADKRVAVRESDFAAAGMNKEAALAAHLKMKAAVNQWVDGAVLRPDQSQKAIWMNDAHFSFIAHMKQFTFAFQDTILKRVIHEAKYGNYQPAVATAAYIPVMLAADLMKGAIQNGGDQPEWKKDWTLTDHIAAATQRAGLLGVGQFGVDALNDLHHGGLGIGALGGPTIGQIMQVARTVGGSRSFEATFIGSMPANALWSGYLPESVTHPDAKAEVTEFTPATQAKG